MPIHQIIKAVPRAVPQNLTRNLLLTTEKPVKESFTYFCNTHTQYGIPKSRC